MTCFIIAWLHLREAYLLFIASIYSSFSSRKIGYCVLNSCLLHGNVYLFLDKLTLFDPAGFDGLVDFTDPQLLGSPRFSNHISLVRDMSSPSYRNGSLYFLGN